MSSLTDKLMPTLSEKSGGGKGPKKPKTVTGIGGARGIHPGGTIHPTPASTSGARVRQASNHFIYGSSLPGTYGDSPPSPPSPVSPVHRQPPAPSPASSTTHVHIYPQNAAISPSPPSQATPANIKQAERASALGMHVDYSHFLTPQQKQQLHNEGNGFPAADQQVGKTEYHPETFNAMVPATANETHARVASLGRDLQKIDAALANATPSETHRLMKLKDQKVGQLESIQSNVPYYVPGNVPREASTPSSHISPVRPRTNATPSHGAISPARPVDTSLTAEQHRAEVLGTQLGIHSNDALPLIRGIDEAQSNQAAFEKNLNAERASAGLSPVKVQQFQEPSLQSVHQVMNSYSVDAPKAYAMLLSNEQNQLEQQNQAIQEQTQSELTGRKSGEAAQKAQDAHQAAQSLTAFRHAEADYTRKKQYLAEHPLDQKAKDDYLAARTNYINHQTARIVQEMELASGKVVTPEQQAKIHLINEEADHLNALSKHERYKAMPIPGKEPLTIGMFDTQKQRFLTPDEVKKMQSVKAPPTPAPAANQNSTATPVPTVHMAGVATPEQIAAANRSAYISPVSPKPEKKKPTASAATVAPPSGNAPPAEGSEAVDSAISNVSQKTGEPVNANANPLARSVSPSAPSKTITLQQKLLDEAKSGTAWPTKQEIALGQSLNPKPALPKLPTYRPTKAQIAALHRSRAKAGLVKISDKQAAKELVDLHNNPSGDIGGVADKQQPTTIGGVAIAGPEAIYDKMLAGTAALTHPQELGENLLAYGQTSAQGLASLIGGPGTENNDIAPTQQRVPYGEQTIKSYQNAINELPPTRLGPGGRVVRALVGAAIQTTPVLAIAPEASPEMLSAATLERLTPVVGKTAATWIARGVGAGADIAKFSATNAAQHGQNPVPAALAPYTGTLAVAGKLLAGDASGITSGELQNAGFMALGLLFHRLPPEMKNRLAKRYASKIISDRTAQAVTDTLDKAKKEVVAEQKHATAQKAALTPTAEPGKTATTPESQATTTAEEPSKPGAKASTSGTQQFAPTQSLSATDLHEMPPLSSSPHEHAPAARAVISQMGKDFGVPIRHGRVRPSKAAGIYKTDPEVVRTQEAYSGSIPVATHEVAHHIDKRYLISSDKNLTPQMQRELQSLDYEPDKRRASEGFAEFMRHLLTRNDAEQVAPKFYQHFVHDWLPKHPKLREAVIRTRKNIEAYRAQGAWGRVANAISQTGKEPRPANQTWGQWLAEGARNAGYRLYAAIKDENVYLGRAVKEARKRGYSVPAGDDPMTIATALKSSAVPMANHAMEKGVFTFGKQPERIGPSLKSVFDKIKPDEYDRWTQWLYARHAREAWAKGHNPGIALSDANQVWREGLDDRFERAAQKLTDYHNALVRALAPSVITPETADKIVDSWHTYVPLNRATEKLFLGRFGRKLSDLGSGVMRRSTGGSGRMIVDPIQATIMRTVQTYDRLSKQAIIDSLYDMAAKTDGIGTWIELVPPKMARTELSVGDVSKQLEDMGIDPNQLDNLDPTERLFFYRPNYQSSGGEQVVRLIRDGQPVLAKVDPDLYRAIAGMNNFHANLFMRSIGHLTNTVKMGYTGLQPQFAIRNVARTFPLYIFQSEKPNLVRAAPLPVPGTMLGRTVKAAYDGLMGRDKDALTQIRQMVGGDTNHLVASLGAEESQFTRLGSRAMRRKVKEVTNDKVTRRVMSMATHPARTLRGLLSVYESGPRMAEFLHVLEKHGYGEPKLVDMLKHGKYPPRHVIVEALRADKDVTLDFQRMGHVGRGINMLVPYFNATIEHTDRFAREILKHPVKSAAYLAAMQALEVPYWYWAHKQDWYKEQPAWMKYGFWTLPLPFRIPGTDWQYLHLPRPFLLGWATTSLPEAIYNTVADHNPSEITGQFKQALQESMPVGGQSVIPEVPGLYQYLEGVANKDFFTGAPIVSESEARLLPADQSNARTLLLSKWIGKTLGMSPLQIQHFADGVTGSLYTRFGDAMAGDMSGFNPLGGSITRRYQTKSIDEFYTQWKHAEQAYASAKRHGKASAEAKDKAVRLREFARTLSRLRKLEKAAKTDEQRRRYAANMIGVAREALGKPALKSFPAVEGTGGPHFVVSKNGRMRLVWK